VGPEKGRIGDSRVKDISSLLSAFFDRETLRAGGAYHDFLDSWSRIVGQRLADHSRPVEAEKGILLVEAEHSGWIQLLQFKQEAILEELSLKYPELKIRTVAFRLSQDREEVPRSSFGAAPLRPPVAHVSEGVETPGTPDATGRGDNGSGLPPELREILERIRNRLKE
jgi:hypothetical protein